MRAFEDLPEFKALPSFFRDEGSSAVTVYMPFADIAGFVTGPAVHLANSHRIGIQRLVIIEDAMSKPVLPGYQTGAIWAAHRTAGDGVAEIDALLRQFVKVRRLHIRIARIAGGLHPPLVSEDKDKIRLPGRRFRCP